MKRRLIFQWETLYSLTSYQGVQVGITTGTTHVAGGAA